MAAWKRDTISGKLIRAVAGTTYTHTALIIPREGLVLDYNWISPVMWWPVYEYLKDLDQPDILVQVKIKKFEDTPLLGTRMDLPRVTKEHLKRRLRLPYVRPVDCTYVVHHQLVLLRGGHWPFDPPTTPDDLILQARCL